MNIANPYFTGGGGADPQRLRLKRRAALASMGVAAVLAALKFYAWQETDAVSMLSSLLDSCFDVVASAIALTGILHAGVPADAHHRYGHGKAEALAALAQAAFVTVSAVFLTYEAGLRLLFPREIFLPEVGIAVTLVAIGLTLGLVSYQRRVIERTDSVAISADRLHYSGDLLMNLGVMTALILSAYAGFGFIDAAFAGGIALYLLWGAWKIGAKSVDILMDRELPSAMRADILATISSHRAVVSVHDLRTRSSGERIFIECHVEMDGALSLKAAHTVTEEIERILFDAYPASELIIHQEPAGLDDHRLDDSIRK